MASNINLVEAQSTACAKAEEERLIKKCVAVVKRMWAVTLPQKNVSKDMKTRLIELEAFEGDFTQVLSRAQKKKVKRDKRQQHIAPSGKPLSKINVDTNVEAPLLESFSN